MGSLTGLGARAYLSRQETHQTLLLTAPVEVETAARAFWYAFARPETGDRAAALRVSRSKLADFSVASSFWKEAAQFFARHALQVNEINDLVDFLHAAKTEDDSVSLKGTQSWLTPPPHGGVASGAAQAAGDLRRRLARPSHPRHRVRSGQRTERAIWRFRQLKTGSDLFREGQRMRHCVVTYKHSCVEGRLSIWLLSCEFPLGVENKAVTLEVRADGTIAQCRGFANRLPHANEVAIVRQWADDYDLTWRGPKVAAQTRDLTAPPARRATASAGWPS